MKEYNWGIHEYLFCLIIHLQKDTKIGERKPYARIINYYSAHWKAMDCRRFKLDASSTVVGFITTAHHKPSLCNSTSRKHNQF